MLCVTHLHVTMLLVKPSVQPFQNYGLNESFLSVYNNEKHTEKQYHIINRTETIQVIKKSREGKDSSAKTSLRI